MKILIFFSKNPPNFFFFFKKLRPEIFWPRVSTFWRNIFFWSFLRKKIQDSNIDEKIYFCSPKKKLILKKNHEIRLLDVRTQHERETASLDNSVLLDQELVEEILGSWDQNTPLMFFCHMGERSRQAAQYFTSQGFQQVYNISDGIKGWSSNVDSSIPQY